MNFSHSHGVGIILDTAFYPTPRSLGLLFSVVQPSYLNDYHISQLSRYLRWSIRPLWRVQFLPKVGVEPTRRRVPMRIYFDIICKVAEAPKSRNGFCSLLSSLTLQLIIAIFWKNFKLFYVEVVLILRRVAYVATYSQCMSKHIRPPAEYIGHNHL